MDFHIKFCSGRFYPTRLKKKNAKDFKVVLWVSGYVMEEFLFSFN